MRLEEWEFHAGHAVYGRAWRETRWVAPLEEMRPRAYLPSTPPGREMPTEGVREPLLMKMVGHPSVTIQQSAQGNTVQTVRLYSRYAPYIRPDQIRNLARQWWLALQRLSRGPYSLKQLRDMGHPYGYGTTTDVSWRRLKAPRKIPAFGIRTRRGARAAVPNRAVINLQSGLLERSWRFSVLPWAGGVTLNFWNEAKSETNAPYPWFLAHGTVRMQAHGPWPYVAEELLPEVHETWRQGAMEAARARALDEAQFGEAAVATQEEEFEAGGFM